MQTLVSYFAQHCTQKVLRMLPAQALQCVEAMERNKDWRSPFAELTVKTAASLLLSRVRGVLEDETQGPAWLRLQAMNNKNGLTQTVRAVNNLVELGKRVEASNQIDLSAEDPDAKASNSGASGSSADAKRGNDSTAVAGRVQRSESTESSSDVSASDPGAQMLTAALGIVKCHGAGCTRIEINAGDFSLCGRCRVAVYCSRECQINHWRSGHKERCFPVTAPHAPAAAVATVAN